ncbi:MULTISPECIES: oxygenase MpaB family protein [unclassified Salinibacterium]|uniref:oxygenase MpaB family protein n=1 Tax=unclassified Salinibacterium TaxID=2632331 RepID=UPI00141E872B|nr:MULTISPECIES: oxygenase MpaB family protein [unclassified Salinibacterium]
MRRGPGIEPWRSRLLIMFSGQPDGLPPWVRALEDGDDAGYFGSGSAAWHVHGSLATIVAGIRALLMQALHPGAMAGVHDWSRYREDPLGRLSGTIRWILSVTFGSSEQARAESARVGRFHDRVQGEYPEGDGVTRAYSAHDSDLLEWVHLAFADAFLGAAEVWDPRIPGGADRYVAEWATAGELVGVVDAPRSEAELRGRLRELRESGALRHDERVAEVVRFLRHPPLGRGMGLPYAVLFGGAVASLPREFRELLGLRRPWWPAITFTRIALRVVARILGQRSTSVDAAERRLARLRREGRQTEPVPWARGGDPRGDLQHEVTN